MLQSFFAVCGRLVTRPPVHRQVPVPTEKQAESTAVDVSEVSRVYGRVFKPKFRDQRTHLLS